MKKSLLFVFLLLLAIIASLMLPQEFVGGCTTGVSKVACENPAKREIVVDKNGMSEFRSIQQAIDQAQPGDHILVRSGIYEESIDFHKSGLQDSPIVLKQYKNEKPVIQPRGTKQEESVILNGSWLIMEGFEIRTGWHGIVINQPHNIVRRNQIHGSGNQGVLVVSTNNIVLEANVIEQNGLEHSNPWHNHGIYLSDYYEKKNVGAITIRKNKIGEHAGAGIHVYNSKIVTENLMIEDNVVENTVLGLVLINTQKTIVRNNIVKHMYHPKTNAPRSTLVWLELSSEVSFLNNTFEYQPEPNQTLAVEPIRNTGSSNNHFLNNTWKIASRYPQISDQDLNR